MRVAVCICTLARPAGLDRLLSSLSRIDVPDDVKLSVVVVENTADGDAVAVVDRYRPVLDLTFATEPRRGITFARNRAVELGRGLGEWIAFLDDDEVVEPSWLSELLRARAQADADVVTGPVLSVFEGTPPAWIVRGGFFDRPRHVTGASVEYVSTGNTLVSVELIEKVGMFHETFALSGGEDTEYFMRCARAGARMVWADSAVVREFVPESRVRMKWLLRRAFRLGNSIALGEKSVHGRTLRVIARRAAKGAGRVVQGIAFAPIALLRGRAGLVSCMQLLFRGLGSLYGVFGGVLNEYTTTHGN